MLLSVSPKVCLGNKCLCLCLTLKRKIELTNLQRQRNDDLQNCWLICEKQEINNNV